MPTVVWTLEQKRARRRLFEGAARILAQQKRVFSLKARGHPTDEARDLLAIFADSQLAMYAAQSACRSRSALRRDLPGGARQRGVST